MTAFDYNRADAIQQAELRGEVIPSPLDVYGRDHSLACIRNATNRALEDLGRYDPDWRGKMAVWDVPKNVDRKWLVAMRALRALRDLSCDELDAARSGNVNICQCKGCAR